MNKKNDALSFNIDKFNKLVNDLALTDGKFNSLFKSLADCFNESRKQIKIMEDLLDESALEFMSIVSLKDKKQKLNSFSEISKNIITDNSDILIDKNNVKKVIGSENLVSVLNIQYDYLLQVGKMIFEKVIDDKKYTMELYKIYYIILDEINFKLNKYNKLFNFNNGVNK
jgi:hypothetical protein